MNYLVYIENRLSPKRVKHSQGVAETAVFLARRYGYDIKKAELAGLLHDYAKNLKEKELLEIAIENNLIFDKCEIYAPYLLHGAVAAYLLEKEGIVYDIDILNAIKYHTFGRVNMTLLEKIIYIADYIEPNRTTANIDVVRKICYDNLDKGLLACVKSTVNWLISANSFIHPFSISLMNELMFQIKETQ